MADFRISAATLLPSLDPTATALLLLRLSLTGFVLGRQSQFKQLTGKPPPATPRSFSLDT